MAEQVLIFDTTLRDGEQTPGTSMNVSQKLRVARALAKLRVDVIEAGFPMTSQGDFEAVSLMANEIRDCQIAALTRPIEKDIEVSWEAIAKAENPRLHVFLSSSDIHLVHQLKMNREEVLEMAVAGVRQACKHTSNVEFSPMDASRTDRDYLVQIIEATIAAGATTINIPDTVGYAVPEEFGGLIKYLFENVSNIDKAVISVHCHNDLGLATANSLAAVMNGARQIEVTVNGIGERAGNAALEEIVMLFRTRSELLGLDTRVNTEEIYNISRLVSTIAGLIVQPNKAIVGANAFAHESGIHQDGILKEVSTYEIMRPKDIGIRKSKLVLGKTSGRHAFQDKLESLGYTVSREDLNRLFNRFKEVADKKKEVFDEDIEAIVADELVRGPEKYKLIYLNVSAGTTVRPTATVSIEIDGEQMVQAGFGTGPIDATYNTIAKMTGTKSTLIHFSISSLTGGTDAQGEVTVRLQEDDHVIIGQGSDPDIIIASAKAYITGLNRLESMKQNPYRSLD
ncbi:MAG: 2-isopropylmalate synthase [Deltaproteobacteria bacterium]|nr:2-isopropylmalate synthase [Deltaproteobacteria bacterium]MBW2052781.1 2-isopropylmalate synthase [Deltaproteobacteria bacterium]MBW2140417.1 2-isopropylmalate synthase [Deltaproteobacteria bacterium]